MSSVTAFLGIRRGEERMTGWVAALFVVTQAGHGLGTNTADALFFVRFGVEFLPRMILLSGIAVMVATLVYAGGLARLGARRWLWPTPLAFAGWVLLTRLGVGLDVPLIYPVIWLSAQVVILVTFTLMWNAAGEVCTARQAKRLFPLFAAAGIAGGVVGNALTGPLAVTLGTENLLVVQAGLLVAAGAVTFSLGRNFFERAASQGAGSVLQDLRAGLAISRSMPLLRLMVWVAAAISLLFFLVTFPFSQLVTAAFETDAQVATFLGVFSSVATAVTFLVSLFLANRLFARLGVVGTLLILPLVYVAGFALWTVSFDLTTATVVRGAQWVAVNALGATAWTALFNVLSGRRRGQVMAFLAAVPTQLGTMASGALLMAGSLLPGVARFLIGLGVALATTVLVLRLRPAYAAALVEAVRGGLVEVFTNPQTGMQKPTLDADAIRALEAGLADPQPGARAVAAATAGRLGEDPALRLLEPVLDDESPRVRLSALRALRDADPDRGRPTAIRMLRDPDAAVRRQAIDIIAADPSRPAPEIAGALEDPDHRVRATAAVLVGGDAGRRTLEDLLDAGSPEARQAALEGLAQLPEPPERDLEPYAADPDRGVRAAAAAALAGQPSAAPVLRQLLEDRSLRVREAAAAGLAGYRHGVEVLWDVLAIGSVRASDAALRALVASGYSGPDLQQWAAGEVARAAYLCRHRITLDGSGSPTIQYLTDLLDGRQRRLEQWALMAITTPETRTVMEVVMRGVRAGDPQTSAQALEALESIGDRSLTRDLIPLFEGEGSADRSNPRAALRQLTLDPDPWIRALALRSLTEELLDDLRHVQQAAAADSSELVRAVAAGWEPPPMHQIDSLDEMGRVLALKRIPMFSELDVEDLERIAAVLTERRYEPGEPVYRAGEEGEEMLLIIAGEAVVTREQGGTTTVVSSFGPGQHVGELAVLRRRPRSADVTAGEAGLHGLMVGRAELQSILEERPEVAMAMLATLAERLATA